MPTIDDARGVLVVRIVYDGPALSGKTTSVRALAEGVSRSVDCPEERDGRTLYFDWVDYIGGLFEGRQIRCQIVSVPGQRELAARRARLLESADAVVCVLDTRKDELAFGLGWLRELVSHCRIEAPPIGIVLQANKRDAADALPKEELRTRVNAIAPIAIVESVATSASGIREAFVLGVRLALDRVRALSAEGRLPVGRPREDEPAELLRSLQRAETGLEPILAPARGARPSTLPPAPPTQAVDQGTAALLGEGEEQLFVADPMMPGGMIWPPVDGRALLHEVASLAIKPFRTPRGDWWGSGSGWRFHSSQRALFADLNLARAELLAWARMHSINAAQISSGRAVILADAGLGRLRLWQLVRVEAALRERLAATLGLAAPRAVAHGLLDIASQLLAASGSFQAASPPLPCTLWTVSAGEGSRPSFVGLMPEPSAPSEPELGARALLQRELGPHLRELRRARVDYGNVAREVDAVADAAAEQAPPRVLASVIDDID